MRFKHHNRHRLPGLSCATLTSAHPRCLLSILHSTPSLPFRALRSDPETDFLAFSLPDAIAASLAGLSSLVVRSSLAAARFAGAVLDLRQIAKEVDVDTVLTGTLLRAGKQLRLTTQLVEAPSGTLIWSKASQVELRDIFQLQDTLVS